MSFNDIFNILRKKPTVSRIERLSVLTSRLRIDEPIVLREVADELGVSLSTINRDIAILREQGVPVETDRGRGGGTRVNSSWGIGRVVFTHTEAIDLLVSIAASEKMELPMMFASAKAIRTKLISSFSKPDQTKIRKLASRIRVGPTSSPRVIASYKPETSIITKRIHESFLFMRSADITYRREDGTLSARTIDPQFMVLNHPVWYLVCWDHLRNDVRTFRCDRLESVKITDQAFASRPWSVFEKSMEGNALKSV